MRRLKRYALVVVRRLARYLRPWLPPRAFDAIYAFGHLGYWPNIERPRSFTEKLLWLRRHDRDPRLPRLADKLSVRDYVAEVAPGLRLSQVLGVYDDPAELPLDTLPDKAVLKSTHASGHVLILRRPFDSTRVRATAAGWLASAYGAETKEWMYEDLPRRLMVEAFLGQGDASPEDFKVFVLNGRARLVQVFRGRGQRLERIMFDRDWRLIPVYRAKRPWGPLIVPDPASLPPRPDCLDSMLEQAERLARPFSFVRVDFYVVDGEPVFGEMTFIPNGGFVEFRPISFDWALGEELELPRWHVDVS